jgi:hypothetical protein
MSNPYQTPLHAQNPNNASGDVQAPAIALIAVAIIAIVVGLFGLAVDVFLLLSGLVERLEAANDGPWSVHTQIIIRTAWGIILLIASSFVLYGALKMAKLESYDMARAATIVSMVPCIGPCLCLGIPFGIWAIVVLSKPHVRGAFRS